MNQRPRLLVFLGLGVALCAAAGLNLATSPADPQHPDQPLASSSAGLRAFVDPETGTPRGATAEELAQAALEQPARLSKSAGIEVIEHPNGMRSAELGEAFMATSVAKIGPDGRLVTECVTSQEQYDAFFANEPSPADPEVQ